MIKTMIGLCILGTLTLHAYDKTERTQDMQTMEAAMAQIQKGILSNNDKMARQGVAYLKGISKKIEIPQNKAKLDYSARFAKKMTQDIVRYTNELDDEIEDGQMHSASKTYAKVLNKCITCHNKIRAWNY